MILKKNSPLYFVVLSFFVYFSYSTSQEKEILIDGNFSEWQHILPIHVDPSDDTQSDDVDFRGLWVKNDSRFLFLMLQVGAEINLQDNNYITLFIDTDNDTTTGLFINEIGADLKWNFGERNGELISENITTEIGHNDIGIVTAPTVTSNQFEVAIDRTAKLNDISIFKSDTINISFMDVRNAEEILPNSGKVSFVFTEPIFTPIQEISLKRKDPDEIRILSYNVLRDNLFENNYFQNYSRILKAVNPDLFGFQEIYNHTSEQTADLLAQILSVNQQYYHSKIYPDIVVVSKFPILNSFLLSGGNGAFLIDLTPKYISNLLLIVAHPPCCDNNIDRQLEIDAIMAFVRNSKLPGGVLDLEPETPILIMGDMNLVGFSRQLQTLITGEIVNKNQYGQSFVPDWDGSDFSDLAPMLTSWPMNFTWYDANNSFCPGRLDFMIFSDSVLKPGNNFVLFTPEMSSDSLQKYGLNPEDVLLASDHLPVVGDFSVQVTSQVDEFKSNNLQPSDYDFQNYPNPFHSGTTIQFNLPKEMSVSINIYNLKGEIVDHITTSYSSKGSFDFTWDGKSINGNDVSGGIYFAQIKLENFIKSIKLLKLK